MTARGYKPPILLLEWEGFIVVDARGHIVCWPNRTPKLYHSAEQAQHSLEAGWTLVPFRLRPRAFEAQIVAAVLAASPIPAAPPAAPDLSPPAADGVLAVLQQATHPLRAKDIAHQLGRSRFTVHEHLRTLHRAGQVQRHRDPEHRGRGIAYVYMPVQGVA